MTVHRWTNRWTCFSKQEPGSARQNLATSGPPNSPSLYLFNLVGRTARAQVHSWKGGRGKEGVNGGLMGSGVGAWKRVDVGLAARRWPMAMCCL